jgi:hypothetical protein
MTLAHRYSFSRFNGPIPDGMLVCHRCDNTIDKLIGKHSYPKIGAMLGVSSKTVGNIALGYTWGWLTGRGQKRAA